MFFRFGALIADRLPKFFRDLAELAAFCKVFHCNLSYNEYERLGDMDFLKRMEEAVDYIERHITEDFDFNTLERIVCCSACQFMGCFQRGRRTESEGTSAGSADYPYLCGVVPIQRP